MLKFCVWDHDMPRTLEEDINGGIKQVCGILPFSY